MRVGLADVLVYAVVVDESGSGTVRRLRSTAGGQRPRALGVHERVAVVDVGQQSGTGLYPVLAGQAEIGDYRAVLGIVDARPLQRILQRDGDGSARGRRTGRVLQLGISG